MAPVVVVAAASRQPAQLLVQAALVVPVLDTRPHRVGPQLALVVEVAVAVAVQSALVLLLLMAVMAAIMAAVAAAPALAISVVVALVEVVARASLSLFTRRQAPPRWTDGGRHGTSHQDQKHSA